MPRIESEACIINYLVTHTHTLTRRSLTQAKIKFYDTLGERLTNVQLYTEANGLEC